MVTLVSIVAVAALLFLGWSLKGKLGSDRIAQLTERRRSTSRMVGRGEFVDGNRHMEVAMAVTQSTLYYENVDMQASLDLDWVREIEYDTELATGGAVARGKVLRLRSNSQTFEFVLPEDTVAGWATTLPARGALPAATT